MDIGGLDIAALGLIVVLGVHGAVKGAVRGLVMLVALTLASMLAGRYSASLEAWRWPVVSDFDNARDVGYMTGWVVIFLAVLLLGVLVAWFLRKVVETADLGVLDRVLGAVVGVLKGALVTALITTGLMVVEMPEVRGFAQDSYALQGTRQIFDAARDLLPQEMATWLGERLEPPAPGD